MARVTKAQAKRAVRNTKAKPRGYHFTIVRSHREGDRWHYEFNLCNAKGHQVMWSGRSYQSRGHCQRAIEALKPNVRGAPVEMPE